MSQSKSVREALWIRKLVLDFGINVATIQINAVNQGAIALTKDWKVNAATKHIATVCDLQLVYANKKMVTIECIPPETWWPMESRNHLNR